MSRRKQRRLVEKVGKVCAGKSDRRFCDGFKVNVTAHRFAFCVNFKNGNSALEIGIADRYLTVETTRTRQRGVEYVGAVGRCHNDNALVRAETVHFNEQLVERLLSLVVSAAETCSAVTTDGVDLIYKYYTCRRFSREFKEVSDTRRTDADVHFHKVRAGYREERNSGLACNRLCKQGLTRSGRAYEQYAVRYLRSKLRELRRIFQELNYLLQLLFLLVGARNVVKFLCFFVVRSFYSRFAETVHLRAHAVGAVYNEEPENDEEYYHYDVRQEAEPPRDICFRLDFELHLGIFLSVIYKPSEYLILDRLSRRESISQRFFRVFERERQNVFVGYSRFAYYPRRIFAFHVVENGNNVTQRLFYFVALVAEQKYDRYDYYRYYYGVKKQNFKIVFLHQGSLPFILNKLLV